jgi:hypothetical protein
VKPEIKGVLVSKGDGFRMSISPYDATEQLLMDQDRKLLKEPGAQILEDTESALVGRREGFGEPIFICHVKQTAGGKPYMCVARREPAGREFIKAEATLMARCARGLTQTEENKKAEVRMAKAIARFKELGGAWQITSLKVEGDQVTDADMAMVKDLPQMTGVTVSAEKVTPAGIAHLRGLPNLTWVTFEGRAATDAWLAALKPLRLHALVLDGTAITAAGLRHLREFPTLEILYLWRQPVAGGALEHLKELPNLKTLEFHETGITDVGLKHLSPLKHLNWLEIIDDPVTDAGLEHLAGLKELHMLKLMRTKVTTAGTDKLKQELRDCEIDTRSK